MHILCNMGISWYLRVPSASDFEDDWDLIKIWNIDWDLIKYSIMKFTLRGRIHTLNNMHGNISINFFGELRICIWFRRKTSFDWNFALTLRILKNSKEEANCQYISFQHNRQNREFCNIFSIFKFKITKMRINRWLQN